MILNCAFDKKVYQVGLQKNCRGQVSQNLTAKAHITIFVPFAVSWECLSYLLTATPLFASADFPPLPAVWFTPCSRCSWRLKSLRTISMRICHHISPYVQNVAPKMSILCTQPSSGCARLEFRLYARFRVKFTVKREKKVSWGLYVF